MKLFKKLKLVLIIIGAIIIALVLSYGWASLVYAKKIYPGVKIGDLDFSGLSKEKAKKLLSEKENNVKDSEIIFKYEDKEYKITGSDLELSYDLDKTVDLLYKTGRDQGFGKNLSTRIKMVIAPQNLFANFEFGKDKFNSFLLPVLSEIEIPVIDSTFQYKDGKIEVTSDQAGQEVSRFKLDKDIENIVGKFFSDNQITFLVEKKTPKVTKAQAEQLLNSAERLIKDEIKLKSEAKNVDINREKILSWADLTAVYQPSKISNNLFFDSNKVRWRNNYVKFSTPLRFVRTIISSMVINTAYAAGNQYQPQLSINQDKIKLFVEGIAKEVNKDSTNAKLSMSGGTVNVFQAGEKGYQLDSEETVKKITDLLMARLKVAGVNSNNSQANNNEIELPLSVKDPEVNDKNINELGLKELISSGTTSFAGSPNNRIANIRRGAELFNGVLIKPGETLSAISVIGNPSAATGFLPELVIKENKTIPEYGGGLCQVSTTLFRAALNAGLEIPERTNHSYRVSYYEPPVGMDATVYYPQPDLKIKNNTEKYILIQAFVSGSKITFDFYGTKDGRKVEISEPVLYDVSSPPEPLYAESSDLAQGEIKRLESAHNGAKADFHYKVTLNGKVIVEQDFHSFYKAWQARYLYGPGTTLPQNGSNEAPKEENTSPAPTSSSETSTSTSTPTTSSSTPTTSTPTTTSSTSTSSTTTTAPTP